MKVVTIKKSPSVCEWLFDFYYQFFNLFVID